MRKTKPKGRMESKHFSLHARLTLFYMKSHKGWLLDRISCINQQKMSSIDKKTDFILGNWEKSSNFAHNYKPNRKMNKTFAAYYYSFYFYFSNREERENVCA